MPGGDLDNDGRLDMAMAGGYHYMGNASGIDILRNTGNNQFTELSSSQFWPTEADMSALAWGDYDGDGYLDFALSGYTSSGPKSYIYHNSTNCGFAPSIQLTACFDGDLAWADYDNDGDQDLAIAGTQLVSPNYVPFTALYRNDGGAFHDALANIPASTNCSMAWGDYDNDGDLDLIISGNFGTIYSIGLATKLFRNDGGAFAEVPIGITGVYQGGVAWADYDNDGWLDLAVCGASSSISPYNPTAGIYRNNHDGTFIDIGAGLTGVYQSSLAWGDYDNDGDSDLAISGYMWSDPNTIPITRIYRNEGGNGFVDSGIQLVGTKRGALAWGDSDNDGDLDLIVNGELVSSYEPVNYVYRNNINVANTPPTAPTGLAFTMVNEAARFSWNASSDGQTPTAGLTYNLRVGSAPGKNDVVAGIALSSGLRSLPSMGNAQKKLSWTLKQAPAGKLYWSVQAIDSAFAGSQWASEQAQNQSLTSIKGLPDNTLVLVPGSIVSATFSNYFYIESDDRSCGIRVAKASHTITAGYRAKIQGLVKTNSDGERYIDASLAVRGASGTVSPLIIINRTVGGGSTPGQAGIADANGLNNVGLLVTVSGKVTKYDGAAGCFYIDDGSGVVSDNGQLGLKVIGTISGSNQVGKMVKVTGVVSCFKVSSYIYRLILAKSTATL